MHFFLLSYSFTQGVGEGGLILNVLTFNSWNKVSYMPISESNTYVKANTQESHDRSPTLIDIHLDRNSKCIDIYLWPVFCFPVVVGTTFSLTWSDNSWFLLILTKFWVDCLVSLDLTCNVSNFNSFSAGYRTL
jgi:hypothetical protein